MTTQNKITNEFTGKEYLQAKGKIPYGMTNDYIFRIVFQRNKYALKGLLCSIIGLNDDDIVDLKIKNEIKPGVSITDKEYRMDIDVDLNDDTTINLEMQLRNYGNWQHRSLSYLCREFDSLDHGADYDQVKKTYHISFLDFDLFENYHEFFATYQMRNARDNHLYTDRFNLLVISLNQIELATSEDKLNNIDAWAKLFKSKTWEELKMVASNNDYMTSAVQTVYLSNEDKVIAKVARERDEFLRSEAYRDNLLKEQSATIAEQNATIAEQNDTIARLQAEIESLKQNNK